MVVGERTSTAVSMHLDGRDEEGASKVRGSWHQEPGAQASLADGSPDYRSFTQDVPTISR